MNTDRALVERFVQAGRAPLAMTGNPLSQALAGSILELDAAGAALLAFVPPHEFVQGAEVVQGGILAAMLDFAMAFAAHAMLAEDRAFATAALTVNLLRPVRPGRCLARGRIVRAGCKLLFATSELVAGDESTPSATATSVMAFA